LSTSKLVEGAVRAQGSSSVSVKNGQVRFLHWVRSSTSSRQDLVKRGFTLVSKIPAVNPTLTLFSGQVTWSRPQTGYRLINDLKIRAADTHAAAGWPLGVFAGPPARRRALIGARASGLAASMLVLAAGAVDLPRHLPEQRAYQ